VATRPVLVLNRFITLARGLGLDLATGTEVWVRRVPAGGPELQRRRSTIAGVVASLRLRGMAQLLDYGPDEHGTWSEAYESAPRGQSGATGGRKVTVALEDARTALGMAGCALRARDHRWPAGAASLFLPIPVEVVEQADDAPPAATLEIGRRTPLLATVVQHRVELDQIIDVLQGPCVAGPRLLTVTAPAGGGLLTLYEGLAREARLRGFIPVSSRLCADGIRWPAGLDLDGVIRLLRRRHIVVLDDQRPSGLSTPHSRPGESLAHFLAGLDLTEGRPHLVVTGRTDAPISESISLRPLSPEQLRRSVLCAGVAEATLAQAVSDAARRSGGWPGAFAAFVASLLGVEADEAPYRPPRQFVHEVREAGVHGAFPGHRTGATRIQIAVIVGRAGELADRGRHAAAERLLRRATGFFRRRGLAGDAARAALALGRLLMARGRRRFARDAFEESRRLFDGIRHSDGVIASLLHLGAVLIDDACFPAAETALRTAHVAADHAEMRTLARAAGLLIARCLFWQGDLAAASRHVERAVSGGPGSVSAASAVAERADRSDGRGSAWGPEAGAIWLPPGVMAIPIEVEVRAALRARDVGRASRRLAAAAAEGPGEDPWHAGVLRAMSILVQGALGDGRAAGKELAIGLERLRRDHAPLVAQELRLAHVEALLDAGERAHAAAQLRRLASRHSPIMSGLARVRLDELSVRARQPDSKAGARTSLGDTHIDAGAVLRILELSQEADDDRGAVAGVCDAVRSTLHAAAVSAFLVASREPSLVANAGGRACRAELAGRSASAGFVVGPEITAGGRDASAPVRYGGVAVGAIAARWTADVVPDDSRVHGMLAAAAAAVGPALAALGGQAGGATRDEGPIGELSGSSAVMAELRGHVARAAMAPYPVLVQGESGTGKELIARAIHAASLRRHRRFCAVNCAALSDDLFETELFGHTRGAFTGAASDRPGLFEEADGGTLFLDEVGELSPRAQAKLLRAIQEGEIRRVGENHSRRVDARIVAATNRTLGDEVRHGRFRHDLLFRLDVVRIAVPPLRDRPEDIAPMAHLFWKDAMKRTGGCAELAPATLAALARYHWPGNVRELQNAIAALAVHAPPRGRIGPSRLPEAIAGSRADAAAESITLDDARRRFEERFVRATLARAGGRRSQAAASLGLTRQGLAKLMTRLGIGDADGGEGAAAGGG